MISIEDYRNSIRIRYADQRLKEDFDFPAEPTPTDIRQRAFWIMSGNPSKSDSDIIKRFFGIRDEENWRKEIDGFKLSKLKPIQSLLDGTKDSRKESLLDFGALIVELENRPFKKFRKHGISDGNFKPDVNFSEDAVNSDGWQEEAIVLKSRESDEVAEPHDLLPQKDKGGKTEKKRSKRKGRYPIVLIFTHEGRAQIGKWIKTHTKQIGFGLGSAAFLGAGVYGAQHYTEKPFMQWQTDHYTSVGTEVQETPSTPIHKMDEAELPMKRIRVNATTTFFIKGEPQYWYIRDNGYVFFNLPGKYPLDYDKELRPVSRVIAEKVRNGEIDVDY